MKKSFSLWQLFSILDGRLSTSIGDVYLMLNHICDMDLMTHHLPVASDYLKSKNPTWFSDWKQRIEHDIKAFCPIKERSQEQFEWVMKNLDYYATTMIDVPQLKDEFDTSDFANYMVSNSLLNKIGTAQPQG